MAPDFGVVCVLADFISVPVDENKTLLISFFADYKACTKRDKHG